MGTLAESELDELVANQNIVIESPGDTVKRKVNTFTELKDRLNTEKDFWRQYDQDPLAQIRGFFSDLATRINKIENTDPDSARAEIARIARDLHDRRGLGIYSSSRTAQLLAAVYEIDKSMAWGAYDYIRNNFTRPQMTPMYFSGALQAALYLNPAHFDKFLELDRSRFDDLRSEITALSGDFASHFKTVAQEQAQWSEGIRKEFDSLMESSQSKFNLLCDQSTESFSEVQSNATKQLLEIEGLYREKLRLESPAEYWKDLEIQYKKSGRYWSIGAGLTSTTVIGVIGWILYNPPMALQAETFTAASIKAALLIAVGVSLAGFVINLFVRMATSAIHLSRDARERRQLTHMFLSLVNEKAMSTEEREIILSALFSRSDTGLLKHDGTPAMASPLSPILDSLRSRT